MAQSDLFKRYMDAGISFTNLTQRRAEALVRELVKAGELQTDQARDAVVELLERSRKNSDRLIELIAKEVRRQITSLGLVSHADLDRIERRVAALRGAARPKAKTATKQPGAKKPAATKKATAKKATAKKATAKKATAKKATAKKATAKKATAKKAPAEKAPAPKVVATPSETLPVDEA